MALRTSSSSQPRIDPRSPLRTVKLSLISMHIILGRALQAANATPAAWAFAKKSHVDDFPTTIFPNAQPLCFHRQGERPKKLAAVSTQNFIIRIAYTKYSQKIDSIGMHLNVTHR